MIFVLPVKDSQRRRRFPLMTLILAAANVYIFLKTALRLEFLSILQAYGFVPARPELRDVFSSMFLHANLAHLVGNLYFLYMFGTDVEDRLGRFRYLAVYLLCGAAAVVVQWWHTPFSPVPLIGASGAISGVSGLFLAYYPLARMAWVFFFLVWPLFSIPAPAFLVVGLWFVEQWWMATLSDVFRSEQAGGVAFWAHVGGFLAGFSLSFVLGTRPRVPSRM